jgi:hypothetical protein
MTIQEGAIRISIPDGCTAHRFDGAEHGMSHCMKAVDFILDTPSARIFLEIKDPEAAIDPETPIQYAEKLCAGKLDSDLFYKYRDSWLYLYASKRLRKKPHYYFVLLSLSTISTDSISTRSGALQKKISLEGPNGPWARPYVDQAFVFNVESWNRNFPQFHAVRI